MRPKGTVLLVVGLIVLTLPAQRELQAQQHQISKFDREAAEQMLRIIRDHVKQYYYDPTYHGVDLDARYQVYDEKIKQEVNRGAAFTDIAAYLSALHDSHTFFIPPRRSAVFDYGFRMEMIGDKAYITNLRLGSDAATKLHPGDEILGLNHFSVNRQDFADLTYFFYTLAPQTGLTFELRDSLGQQRQEFVKTTVQNRGLSGSVDARAADDFRHEVSFEHLMHERSQEMGDALIWKVPGFFESDDEVDGMIARARRHKALIIDLRGNHGGSGEMVARMISGLMDHEVKVATRVSRTSDKPFVANSRGKEVFAGKLVVLVDSVSASASEVFARVIQIEHRGIVVGDRSSGRVMETIIHPLFFPGEYAVAITDANLIMSDGKSLEGMGVVPDVIVLPTAADLAAGRDPALSKAAELVGLDLDPTAAGKLFPFEWAPLSAE